jgi:hypothetical protein
MPRKERRRPVTRAPRGLSRSYRQNTRSPRPPGPQPTLPEPIDPANDFRHTHPDAREKLQIAPQISERMRGTVSFPFQPGEHKRIAVKVIDFRGNEVVRVVELAGH